MKSLFSSFKNDASASVVVFLVAVPLCLGIALASGAPLYSGMIAGMVGGLIVGAISKSQLSVTGPAAGLTAIVLSSIHQLGSFESFLLAVVVAGLIQLIAGFLKAGTIANYFPSNVIKGMLTAIGIIIIMKQIPHAVGYDKDSEGDFAFLQTDGQNTFSEILNIFSKVDIGATLITLVSLFIILLWNKPFMKKFKLIPGGLVAVIIAVLLNELFRMGNTFLALNPEHLVTIPVANTFGEFINQFTFPDFTQLTNVKIYTVAFTIAVVASIETLLSLEAIDKIDPQKRISPANLELKAQGLGNIVSGILGGLPVTSVIVRSSANVDAGAKTKVSTMMHGFLILICVGFIPNILNKIPLAALAAILLVTGYKLANPSVFKEMFKKDKYMWIPFLVTVLAIVFTDLLMGVSIGLAVSIFAVLRVNYKNPYYFQRAKQKKGETIKIEFAQEVSFLNKANIAETLDHLPQKSSIILDGSKTKYLDPDVLEIIKEFRDIKAPNKHIKLILTGFQEHLELSNTKLFTTEEKYLDASNRTQELQNELKPVEALNILKEGNFRFANNLKIPRNLLDQVSKTSSGQFPLAVVLSCIDSRSPVELLFDQGLGDLFSIRIAGNTVNEDILGSMEFACKIAGAKMIVVLGHSKCGAIKGACDNVQMGNLSGLINKILPAVIDENTVKLNRNSSNELFVERVSKINVYKTVDQIKAKSPILKSLIDDENVGIIGAMYDVESGLVEFYQETSSIKHSFSETENALQNNNYDK